MWQELPKLFDRDFAYGFLLPAAAFVAACNWLLSGISGQTLVSAASVTVTLPQGATFFSLLTVALALALAGLNHACIRCLEGYYWPVKNLSFLRKRQLSRRSAILRRIEELEAELTPLKDGKSQIPRQLVTERAKLLRRLKTEFPDQEEFVLPTSFGNVVRAFEVYSRSVHGLDSIPGWMRLLAVIPSQFQEYISSAKASVNAAANVFYLSLVFSLCCIARLKYDFDMPVAFAFAISVSLAFLALQTAKWAAAQWGELVKSAFDVYICELSTKLGYTLPDSLIERREFWTKVSQTMIYGIPFEQPHCKPNTEARTSNFPPNTKNIPRESE